MLIFGLYENFSPLFPHNGTLNNVEEIKKKKERKNANMSVNKKPLRELYINLIFFSEIY